MFICGNHYNTQCGHIFYSYLPSHAGGHQIASPPSLVGDVGMASESADECELEVDDDTDEKEYVILLRKVNTGTTAGI